MNVQGRDPSMYEMLLKMHTIQRRLINKTESAISKDVQLRELERINGELKKQMIRLPGPDVGEKLNQLRDVINAKNRQVKVSHVSAFNCIHMESNLSITVCKLRSTDRRAYMLMTTQWQ